MLKSLTVGGKGIEKKDGAFWCKLLKNLDSKSKKTQMTHDINCTFDDSTKTGGHATVENDQSRFAVSKCLLSELQA